MTGWGDLSIRRLKYSNQVRVLYKVTDFVEDKISLKVRLGKGRFYESPDEAGLGLLTELVFLPGGLEAHNQEELELILEGHQVGWSFQAKEDAFIFNGTTNRKGLLKQLQLLAAYLTAPGYREESLPPARRKIPEIYHQAESTIRGQLDNDVSRWLAGGDHRFGLPDMEQLLSYTMKDVQIYLNPQLRGEKLEISIVGDFDPEVLEEALQKTVGAMPRRGGITIEMDEGGEKLFKMFQETFAEMLKDEDLSDDVRRELKRFVETPLPRELMALSRPKPGQKKTFFYESGDGAGRVNVYWAIPDRIDAGQDRRLSILAEVFSERMRREIDEELLTEFRPVAISRPSTTYQGQGWFVAAVKTSPDNAESMAGIVLKMAEDLAQNGVGEKEWNRTIDQYQRSIRHAHRTNQYWLSSVLYGSHDQSEKIFRARDMDQDLASINVEKINSLAASYLSKEKGLTVLVLPREREGN